MNEMDSSPLDQTNSREVLSKIKDVVSYRGIYRMNQNQIILEKGLEQMQLLREQDQHEISRLTDENK